MARRAQEAPRPRKRSHQALRRRECRASSASHGEDRKGLCLRRPEWQTGLKDLFEGRQQLIVYHFMFDPRWDKGCPGCTGWVDGLGDLSLLKNRDTTFVVISRAPLAKLDAYKAQKRWSIAWFSSFGSDFNYDFHVTLDPKIAPAEYNYRNKAEMTAAKGHAVLMEGEEHGLSVFFRLQDSPPDWPQKPTYP